jgi:hypothetical protein
MPGSVGNLAIAAALMGLLAGCVAPAERPDARAELVADEFNKTIDVVGPMMIDNPLFGIKDNFRLVTHIDRQTHAVMHVIEIELDYDGSFFNFRYAADDTGEALSLVPVKRARNVFGQDRSEMNDVIVPDAALRTHAATGYRVKLSARDGTYYIIALTPTMIAAQYAGIAEAIGTMGSSANAHDS